MKINIISVGKLKESYYLEAFDEYVKRLTPFCTFSLTETPECVKLNNADEIKLAEGRNISERLLKSKGFTVSLDRTGDTVDSQGFADIIDTGLTKSGSVNFVIGGSHGLSGDVLKQSDRVVSFGAITYPHQLFRVILAEQIYRAFMIRANRAYHK
ncbi:MAG: 23S rRNA (pseudouridine(1915)-N(3))-methyltransferase RlmH [Clostridiales bacterium]|jgi:23S rRNA (pseudouridine1915-N3)-methyltransferase|nr:23S rRNA (pseudouridine(1915)-N(3))-methyltransferase RlmH [Clostridiales bacterium]